MLYVLRLTFFSPPLIFTLVAASISHFLTAAIKIFMFFFQRNWSSLLFLLFFIIIIIGLFLALALSLCSTLTQTLTFSWKKDSALLLFFSLLKSGWLCNLPPKYAGCLKGKFSLQLTCARAPLLRLTNATLYCINTLFSHPIFLIWYICKYPTNKIVKIPFQPSKFYGMYISMPETI